LLGQRGAQHREQGSAQQGALGQQGQREALDWTDVGHGELLLGAGASVARVKEIFFLARTLKHYPCQIIRVNP
jgi:hypothetical protein